MPGRVPDQGAALALGLGDEQLARIFVRFAEANAGFMERLRGAYEGQDWGAVRLLAHGLKGSAGNLCAEEVYEAALALERASASLAAGGRGDPPDPSLVDRLEAALQPLLVALGELLSRASE